MGSLGERIRDARKAHGMKQRDLGAVIGESVGTISNWERGINKPDIDKAMRICQVLNVPPSDMFDCHVGEGEKAAAERELLNLWRNLDADGREWVMQTAKREAERCSQKPAPQIIPLPTRPIRYAQYPVSAGTGEALDAEQFEAIDIPLTPESRQADFVLRVAGDSMEPEYHDGDLLLIQHADALELGELGVFVVNGDGYFKRCGEGQLESLNPAYRPIQIGDSDTVQTFGRVIGTTEQV